MGWGWTDDPEVDSVWRLRDLEGAGLPVRVVRVGHVDSGSYNGTAVWFKPVRHRYGERGRDPERLPLPVWLKRYELVAHAGMGVW